MGQQDLLLQIQYHRTRTAAAPPQLRQLKLFDCSTTQYSDPWVDTDDLDHKNPPPRACHMCWQCHQFISLPAIADNPTHYYCYYSNRRREKTETTASSSYTPLRSVAPSSWNKSDIFVATGCRRGDQSGRRQHVRSRRHSSGTASFPSLASDHYSRNHYADSGNPTLNSLVGHGIIITGILRIRASSP
jgi:hypothetical protein